MRQTPNHLIFRAGQTMNTLPDPAGDRQPDAGGTENLRPLLVAVLVITSAGIGCGRRPPQDGTIDSRQPLNSATSNAGQQIEADVTAVFSELASELTSTVIARTGTGSPRNTILESLGSGVAVLDYDRDGDGDIYVANDTTPNALYENHRNERLVEVGLYSGTSLGLTGAADGSMGVDAADTDGDGLPDLWVTNFERESFGLYRNAGDLLFQNVSLPTGIGRLARSYVGFGTAFLDLDANGFEDLFATNGHVMFQPRNAPRKQQPILLHNESGTRFRNIAATAGHYFSAAHTGRGTAIGDLDGDGDQDLAITHADEPLALLRNDGQPARVLRLRLVGTTSHRDAVGAIATLQTSKRQLIRLIKGGGSYLSASEKTICFLLPAAEQPKTLAIRWPAGSRSEYAISPDGGFFTATEGEDALQVTAGETR